MKKWQRSLMLVGRLFISLLFILSAINTLVDWQEAEHSLMNFVLDWQSYTSFSPEMQNLLGGVLEWIPLFLILFVALQLVGGVFLFLGIKVRFAAFLLLLFLIFSLQLFHPFWFFSGTKKELELALFLKDLAIMGGLLYVYSFVPKKEEKDKLSPEINVAGAAGANVSGGDPSNLKTKEPVKVR